MRRYVVKMHVYISKLIALLLFERHRMDRPDRLRRWFQMRGEWGILFAVRALVREMMRVTCLGREMRHEFPGRTMHYASEIPSCTYVALRCPKPNILSIASTFCFNVTRCRVETAQRLEQRRTYDGVICCTKVRTFAVREMYLLGYSMLHDWCP